MQDQWPELARAALHGMVDQLRDLGLKIEKLETHLHAWHRKNETSLRLAKVPGIGPITASAIVAAVPDASNFRSGRQFAAWLGLTPKAHSSGGKERHGGISKQGDGYIRRLLVVGATSVIRVARKETVSKLWATKMLERKPARVVSVALANKTARIVWAMLARGEDYVVQAPAAAA
jgi:transposase